MKKYLLLTIGTLLTFIIAIPGEFQAKNNKTFGIDVSHHNGDINWKRVPKVKFVYIKATEGATYVDPKFKDNLKGARNRKLRVGAYHYFRTSSSVQAQFYNYKRHVRKRDIDLIPMIDVEECKLWSKKRFQDSLSRFVQLVRWHYGKAPMIYSVGSFYNIYCAPKFNRYHLMIGRYGKNKPAIKGKGTYTIWQKSEKGRINGISHNVDINVFHPSHSINEILYR